MPLRAADCGSLKGLQLDRTSVQIAEQVDSGKFGPPYGDAVSKVPRFCRVAGTMTPSSDSRIHFEVWLPAQSDWNGKFLGVGNGGFAGAIDYRGLGNNLRRHFATAATDTGHDGAGTDASWAYRHPEKVVDFGYRAIHLTAVNAKAIARAFYGEAPQHSYFDSCSDGGREALMEAQRFPEDYDGILAGAPANYWTHLVAGGLGAAQTLIANPAAYISRVKVPAIETAVLAACDATDGVKDGIVSDPERCHFDPRVLQCQGPESRACLTAPQIEALRNLYAGSRGKSGKVIFPGFVPGAEGGPGGWGPWILGDGPGGSYGSVYQENYLRYMVFSDPTFNVLTASVDSAVQTAEEKTAQDLNATDPDLSRFHARGGKLILYHGWNDPAISAWNSINYYQSVRGRMGPQKADSFLRLYMLPGVQHCAGGPGPSAIGQFGIPTAKGDRYGVFDGLERWVEQKRPPGEVIATKYRGDNSDNVVVMTRPVCAYPATPQYEGSGDTNDATNFSCGVPGNR